MYVTIRKDYEVKNYAVYAILGYDKAGRLVEVAYEMGLKIEYVYDAGRNITEITKTN